MRGELSSVDKLECEPAVISDNCVCVLEGIHIHNSTEHDREEV